MIPVLPALTTTPTAASVTPPNAPTALFIIYPTEPNVSSARPPSRTAASAAQLSAWSVTTVTPTTSPFASCATRPGRTVKLVIFRVVRAVSPPLSSIQPRAPAFSAKQNGLTAPTALRRPVSTARGTWSLTGRPASPVKPTGPAVWSATASAAPSVHPDSSGTGLTVLTAARWRAVSPAPVRYIVTTALLTTVQTARLSVSPTAR